MSEHLPDVQLREQLSDALVMLLNRRNYNDGGSRRSTILTNAVDDAIEAALTRAICALSEPPAEAHETLLRQCLEIFAHPNFTDRHGMADRIRVALTTGDGAK